MSMKITGFDDLEKQLKKMQKRAKELSGTNSVSFDVLFNHGFMQRYSRFSTFDELLEVGGFVVESQEDFENIPDDEFDVYIREVTNFSSWEKMFEKATENYIAKKLGF